MGKEILRKYIRNYQSLRRLEGILLGLCVAALCFGGLNYGGFLKPLTSLWMALSIFVLISWGIWYFKIKAQTKTGVLVADLQIKHPEFEFSLDLLFKNESDLSLLEKVQLKKLHSVLAQKKEAFQTLKSLPVYVLSALVALLLAGFSSQIAPSNNAEKSRVSKAVKADMGLENTSSIIPELKEFQVQISPPRYTSQASYTSTQWSLEALEGSVITWEYRFKGDIEKALLVFSDQDTLVLRKKDGRFWGQRVLKKSDFYQLLYQGPASELISSDYYQLRAIPDEKPLIQISGLPEYMELEWPSSLPISFSVHLKDDYGISSAYVMATVSRGEGESVKFREEKITFSESFDAQKREYQLKKSILLNDLKMAPGDELYLFIEAWDNRSPQNQRQRSDTYFIALADTSQESLSLDLGPGLKTLPEYFRSQRQLIIDTEKLLREKGRISTEEFEQRSGDIGVDQKILRLRYGKFLGEEFETTMGSGHQHEEGEEHYEGDGHEEDDEEHQKWKERRSSLSILNRNEKDHEHNNKNKMNAQPDMYSGVPEDVMHLHDMMEEATFFDETLKAQLKAALSNMWDSELRLRTFQSKASLPYQYRALKLIKEIQQKSRVYVERIGFEPPPLEIKAKRFTGELDKISNIYRRRQEEIKTDYPKLRQCLEILGQSKPLDSKSARLTFQAAGGELAQIAIERPGKFLKALKILRDLANGQLSPSESREVKAYLKSAIWQALPAVSPSHRQSLREENSLQQIFLEKLSQ